MSNLCPLYIFCFCTSFIFKGRYSVDCVRRHSWLFMAADHLTICKK